MLKIFVELALIGAIASVFIVAAQGRAAERAAEEAAGREYMRTLDEITSKAKNKKAIASWNYESNITAYNEEIQVFSIYVKYFIEMLKVVEVLNSTNAHFRL